MKQAKRGKKNRDLGKTIEVLYKISESVGSTLNLNELYIVIHQSLKDILNVDNFYIALYNEENDTVSFPYHVDEYYLSPKEIPDFSSISSSMGIVLKKRKPMVFKEDKILTLPRGPDQSGRDIKSKIWLGAPLIIGNRVKGAIVVQDYSSASAYEREDLDLLNSVSQHIALVIERKEAEQKLSEQRYSLEKILDYLPVGIALVQNRMFKWVNKEMVRLFGYQSKSDFEGKSTRMIYLDDKDYEVYGKKIYKGLSLGAIVDFEIRLSKKDGAQFPVQIRLNSGDETNPSDWTIAIFSDISQRKAAEKEKIEKERLQGVLEMAGAVCHEINQPLQAILGYSELLLMGSESPFIEKKNLHSIKNQASRLGKITRKLSGITRYKTLDYPGNTKIFDIWNTETDAEH